jgi:tetratricopeptide (TPR) repeat protein
MSKTGRNEPCPCGSGLKYKKCCAQKDEALGSAEREARNAQLHADAGQLRTALTARLDRYQQYMQASRTVLELIDAGQLDQAEVAARDFIEHFSEAPDGYDRMGAICEARGERAQAVQWYQKVIDFMRAHPEHYSANDAKPFHRLIQKLDPAASG